VIQEPLIRQAEVKLDKKPPGERKTLSERFGFCSFFQPPRSEIVNSTGEQKKREGLKKITYNGGVLRTGTKKQ